MIILNCFRIPNVRSRCATSMVGVLTASVLVVVLGACGSGPKTQSSTFPFSSSTLEITNQNSNFPVIMRAGGEAEIAASVQTTTAGRGADDPGWTLNGTTLDVGSPCGEGYFGVCEGSYTVTVPAGTTVTLNGTEIPVR